MSGAPPREPRDAATVLLLRDAPGGGFEVFMVRRHEKSGFMGGAHVFPGGKLDVADCDERILARVVGREAASAVAALGEAIDPQRALGLFVAAVRETFEEAGVLLADTPPGVDLGEARRRLDAGEPFAAVVESIDAKLRLDRLVPHSRWITPEVEPRRFDTRFFVAHAPPDQTATYDERETTEAEWLAPSVALERERASEILLPPPTMRTLELLSALGSARDVIADAERRAPPLVRPVFRDDDGTWMLVLPGDPEHPERTAVVAGPTRFVLVNGRFWSGDPRQKA